MKNMSPREIMLDAQKVLQEVNPFLASIVSKLQLRQNNDIQTVHTDGKYFFYNQHVIKNSTAEEQNYFVAFIAMKLASDHKYREVERNEEHWNSAIEIAINNNIVKMDPKEDVFSVSQYSRAPKYNTLDMDAEQIYDFILKEEERKKEREKARKLKMEEEQKTKRELAAAKKRITQERASRLFESINSGQIDRSQFRELQEIPGFREWLNDQLEQRSRRA